MNSTNNNTASFYIPSGNLTQDRLDEWWALESDRQRFVWALQTETRVRAHKVQQRDITHTLQSSLLLDIYLPAPEDLGEYDPQIPKRDVSLYLRKVNYAVFGNQHYGREPNGEFDALAYPLDLKPPPLGYDSSSSSSSSLVPPNMLFFDMLLEAYCGYPMQGHFHPTNPNMPRAAIMGGAIVAVIMAWRDPVVTEMKEWDLLDQWFSNNPSPELESYEMIAERLQRLLQEYFYEGTSGFVAGDVDIFLQPSPLTRSLACHLAQHGIGDDLVKHISEFMAGFEFCGGDLERMATQLCQNLIVPAFERIGPLVYSATQRGLSFALTTQRGVSLALSSGEGEGDQDTETRMFEENERADSLGAQSDSDISVDLSDDGFHGWPWLARERWPRNTQLIMLNERADLLGALLDFDISVAAVAYDGIQVRATPRAVLSLLTSVLVVTPFVLAEKRNRRRIVKYCNRGFRPYMLDPFCCHPRQCRHDCCAMTRPVFPMEEGKYYCPRNIWDNFTFDSHNTRENPDNFADRRRGVCNCSFIKEHISYFKYTFGVVAKTEEHLFEFLSKKNQWSHDYQNLVRSIHPMARLICDRCREDYVIHLLLEFGPLDFGDSIDELLHGEMCYASGGFYAAGAFDGTRVRAKARTTYSYMRILDLQTNAEKVRYLLRHGSYDGYKQRFTFGYELKTLLEQVSEISFAEPGRRPLGLNPERFVADCSRCQKPMLGREYGTQVCEECENRLLMVR